MLTDISGELAWRQNATLEVNWNIQPWVGGLIWGVSPLASGDVGAKNGLGAMHLSKREGGWLSLWKRIGGQPRTKGWRFGEIKDRREASKDAGEGGLGTAKGAEGHRLMAG